MLSNDVIAQLAAELDASEKSRVQVEHFSKRFPGMTIEDGYAVSRAWVAMKIAAGRTVRGHKIGLTSRAMQISSQIDEPDYGTLLDDMFFEPGDIPAQRFIAPRVEVELAFVLKKKLEGGKVTVDDVLDATDYVTPAIEIIDARIEQFDRHTKVMRKVFDTISDNAATPASCWAATRWRRARWTCPGAAPSCGKTVRWKKPAWPPACRATLPWVWPGWCTSWRPGVNAWRLAKSCWPARSPGLWRRRPATCLTPTTARSGALNSGSFRKEIRRKTACRPPPIPSSRRF
jgi:hypothetical protein